MYSEWYFRKFAHLDFLGVTNKKAVLDTGKTTLNSELNYLGTEAERLQNASHPCASSPVWLH